MMKRLKSKKRARLFLVLLSVIFSVAVVSDDIDVFNYDLSRVSAIGNCIPSSCICALDGQRIKCNFLETALRYQCLCDNSPLSVCSSMEMELQIPRDLHLPTKSDRAPPEKIFS